MSKNYYDETLEKIDLLIKDNKLQEAHDLIQSELRMPYIPEIYEVKFIEIINDIKRELVGDGATNAVPREVAIEYLLSEDEQQESIALELLRDHNLRYDIDLIKKRIETWPFEKNMMKAYLFELLIEQQIDVDINFNGMVLNPSKTRTILDSETVVETMKEIPNHFDSNPAAENMALDEFQRFLLITYPAVPEDGKEFAKDISQIVKSMFDDEVKLSDKQKRIKELLSK